MIQSLEELFSLCLTRARCQAVFLWTLMFSLWPQVDEKQMGCGDSLRAHDHIQPVHSTDQPAGRLTHTGQSWAGGGKDGVQQLKSIQKSPLWLRRPHTMD